MLPPYSLPERVVAEIRAQTEQMARALGVVGLMNVQFAVQGDVVFVLEVNPRASRTVPFVAKATGVPIAKIAARVMAGEPLASFARPAAKLAHVASRKPCSRSRAFPGVDIILGPEMKSTGEVMGIDADFGRAFAKSQIAIGVELPRSGTCFISVRDSDKVPMVDLGRRLVELGFKLMGDPRHRRLSARARPDRRAGQQGARGPAALRRRDAVGRDPDGVQHRRGRPRRRPTASACGAPP